MATHKPPAISVIEAICGSQWAMTEEYLRIMVEIAGREHEITIEALEAYRARRVADAEGRFSVRNGVGIITAQGPMFRYADFFSSISGATTYAGLALDVTRARDDGTIRSILLNIDSPGGEINGVQELAAMIRAIDRSVKPVFAYIGGTGASAAYLLAAAAREIVVAPNAILGSIGVRSAIRDTTARDERSGVRTFEFVSSQSPNKALDLSSDEGRARVQRVVDELAAVFIRQVGEFRGLSSDQVISQFGQGGVEVGERAVEVGMADRLGSFESTLSEVARGAVSFPVLPPINATTTKGPNMTAATETISADALADAVAKARADAIIEAKERMRAILALDAAKGREDMARTFAIETDLPVDKIAALLKAAPAAPAAATPQPPATPEGRRSAEQQDGLLHAEPPAPKPSVAAFPDRKALAAIYARHTGKAA